MSGGHGSSLGASGGAKASGAGRPFDPAAPRSWPSKIDWADARKEPELGRGGEKLVFAYPDRASGEFAIGFTKRDPGKG